MVLFISVDGDEKQLSLVLLCNFLSNLNLTKVKISMTSNARNIDGTKKEGRHSSAGSTQSCDREFAGSYIQFMRP